MIILWVITPLKFNIILDCLPLIPDIYSIAQMHNDPAALQNHSERCRIWTQDRCLSAAININCKWLIIVYFYVDTPEPDWGRAAREVRRTAQVSPSGQNLFFPAMEEGCIQLLILHQVNCKNMMNSSFSSYHPGAIHPFLQIVLVQKQPARQGIE